MSLDPIPGPSTLNKYAKNGMISSSPKSREKLAGRNYSPLCRDGNETSDEKQDHPLLRRILEDGQTTQT
jgi:hypothetical protein